MRFKSLRSRLDGFVAHEGGASAVEYAIIAAMIAGAVVLAVQSVGGALTNVFLNIANNIS